MPDPSARKPESIDAFVGSRIALRRAALGLSQSALGQRLGISFQQVQKYETGVNRVSASRLHAVAGVLCASVADFFPSPDGPPQPANRDDMAPFGLLTATTEGRAVATGFPLIAEREVRQALARIVEELARTP